MMMTMIMKMIVTIKIIAGKTNGLIKEVNAMIRGAGAINGEVSVTVGLANVAGDNPVSLTMNEITFSTEGADPAMADVGTLTEEDANLTRAVDSNMDSPDAVRNGEKTPKVVVEVLLQWIAKKFAALQRKEAVHPTVD